MQKEVLLEIVKQNHANHFSVDRVNEEMHPSGRMTKQLLLRSYKGMEKTIKLFGQFFGHSLYLLDGKRACWQIPGKTVKL